MTAMSMSCDEGRCHRGDKRVWPVPGKAAGLLGCDPQQTLTAAMTPVEGFLVLLWSTETELVALPGLFVAAGRDTSTAGTASPGSTVWAPPNTRQTLPHPTSAAVMCVRVCAHPSQESSANRCGPSQTKQCAHCIGPPAASSPAVAPA